MKIQNINAKLKHKILQIELPTKQRMTEDEQQIEVNEGDPNNKVAIVQMSDEWMKIVLKGSPNTYLIEYNKLYDQLMQRISHSQGLDFPVFEAVARKWAASTEEAEEVKGGQLEKFEENDVSEVVQEFVDKVKRYLSSVAEMVNGSNAGLMPGQELEKFTQFINLPHDIKNGQLVQNGYYVVVSQAVPYALMPKDIVNNRMAEFRKLIDPIIWFGTLLEGDGNIDDPNVPLGITA